MIYPLLWMVMSSFKETGTIFTTAGSLIPETFTLENYTNGWKGFAKVPFSAFFKNSMLISVLATLGTIMSSALVAYGFARFKFFGHNILFCSYAGYHDASGSGAYDTPVLCGTRIKAG